jgi:hypothetical protein
MTIEVLDAFGTIAGMATVEWSGTWSSESVDEVRRVFDEPVRVTCPPGRNDPRMLWSLRARLA